ncbi:SulP family inorganic anion transporter [Hyphomonas sp. FCG-A18]|jgi:SulP family sulfate permease|uniref:SulP family inorganic anion transporter n=1 Tax=Hyphomonas sp. FCG-A18 TaxID=3080019 RepID=UPI002B31DA91|nr:SulP family inorganic anion transporter [Hyphomonas sp. FCG-A18]
MARSILHDYADRMNLSAWAETQRATFTPNRIKIEILAGLTVALALVPEAVAFAFVAGVPPLVGLYAAFIVGLITAIMGGRPGMISGATGALAVVMVSLVAVHGVEYLLATVVLMGILQVLAGVFKMGKFIRLVPHPVMLGFVNGLAIVIGLAQIGQFQVPGTATPDPHSFLPNGDWLPTPDMLMMIGLIVLTMAIIWGLPKVTKVIPAPLAGIGIVAAIVIGFGLNTPIVGDLASIKGGLPSFHIPFTTSSEPVYGVFKFEGSETGFAPIPPLNLETLYIIFPYALILAAIGLIESLLTLNLVGEITNKRGGASQECVAQGTSNIVTGFFGGMGGCAMIGQSMINVKSGGRTRLSGISAALFLLAFILVGSQWIEMIPLAALVGVMFMVVIGTFAWNSLRIMRKIPWTDAFVIILVTVVTVLEDLAVAVVVGVIVSALVYAWNNAKQIRILQRDSIRTPGATVYEIEGPLFFGSTDGFAELFHPEDDPEVVIIDFMRSRIVDQSALQAIEDLAAKYQAKGKTLKLRHLSRDCHTLLTKAGQLMIDSEDDPDYEIAADYNVRTGIFGGGH